ncbi:MAG: type II toxin-antitoxin system VapC family toxin [Polyangiaceae bacterium]|nr:type II toxin-antitoxin system VapC family toxin [Polyangiaceae bacterium]
MGFLLDTCVVSEVWRATPNGGVIDWLQGSAEDELFMSVLSLGELKKGIEKLPSGKKKQKLLVGYGALRSRFSARMLGVTDLVAERWGALSAEASLSGRHLHVVDGLVAATALVFGLTVVTRNVSDFAMTSVPLVNPWA